MSKTVLITGTSTGFGKIIVKTLSEAGFQVIATMRGSEGRNQGSATELSGLTNVEVVELDVTDDASVQKAMVYINSKYPKIDVLINNAGVGGVGIAEAYSIDQFKQMFDVNVFGVMRMYQAVLPSMRSAGAGLVINFSSVNGMFSFPYLVPYSSSKFALEAINEGMQNELSQFNIDNVSLVIGAHPTEMNNGVKSGLNSDLEAVTSAYGQLAQDRQNATGDLVGANMHRNDLQHLAGQVLKIINMETGTRPSRVPIDEIAEGTDRAFIEGVKTLKGDWAKKYNIVLKD
ncbi:SDR family NAD(P)-dependent oxidoreductase [Pedobacter hartonius]|uniref:Short chain dehydrogenase n=1 Tax=Pedobacter hartonius TaxID=425514 RepID=A0A1H4BWQ0_9SPHI|nr:SDR family NAD(P)-dependent oxidoreductase [Pedobacter hartonius]SEA52262.1 short chain dehydrogenase [Pedobacter hartonius]